MPRKRGLPPHSPGSYDSPRGSLSRTVKLARPAGRGKMDGDPDWAQLLGQPHDTPPARRTARAAWSRSGLGLWALGPLIPLVVVVLIAINLPPAISAALGHGTRGSFTAVQYDSSPRGSGSWTGTFTPANDGPAIQDVTYNGLSGVQPGGVVPALYVGGEAYAAHGSTEWVTEVLILLAALVVFVSWCRRVPLRHRRQRGSVPPPPWVRTT